MFHKTPEGEQGWEGETDLRTAQGALDLSQLAQEMSWDLERQVFRSTARAEAPPGFLLSPPLTVKLFFSASFICHLETLTNSSVSHRNNTRNNEAWLPRGLCLLADYERWLKLFPITGHDSYNISSRGFLGLLNVYSHSIIFHFSGLFCGVFSCLFSCNIRKTEPSLLLVYLFEIITKKMIEEHT